MNLAENLMAISAGKEAIYGHHHYRSVSSSSSSFSDDDDDSVFKTKKLDPNDRVNREMATILAANRLMAAQERESCRPKKKNIYVQNNRVKHSSGGSTTGSKKMAAAWKRITDKFGKPQHKNENATKEGNENFDQWRRYSLDAPKVNGEKAPLPPLHHPTNLTRLWSLERDARGRQPMRPRSNSEVSHFKILSKHAENADFTVTEPSKLADASALCQEYFSRLTCYDAAPNVTNVIAVDKRIQVSKIFNIFCDHNATAVVLWDSSKRSVVGTCHVDELVCHLWNKGRRSDINRLFDVEGDFSRSIDQLCSGPQVLTMPADTSLMEAARFICSLDNSQYKKSSKRLALINQSTNDVVHLLSAWDILHFFSQQVSKFHAAHTAFDLTLGSILSQQQQQHSSKSRKVLTEQEPLERVIGSLASNGGGSVVCLDPYRGKHILTTITFVDIIQYVANAHGSWNEADVSNKTLGHVLQFHSKKDSLVFSSNTPLFAVLQDWSPSMTADRPIVVTNGSSQNVLGVLEPEHLLQALLINRISETDHKTCSSSGEDWPVATRL